MTQPQIQDESGDKYKYGFVTSIEADTVPVGLSEEIIRLISAKKEEPKLNDSESLRKKILDAQLNYINNASKFIKELEKKDDYQIYQDLIDLNDIRFIQHSLSKLSINTLDRLLIYLENKTDKEKHSIDMFIIEVIKKYLHSKMH